MASPTASHPRSHLLFAFITALMSAAVLAFSPALAQAATAPTGSTEAVSSVTVSGGQADAVLNGEVNPGGSPATWGLEVGTAAQIQAGTGAVFVGGETDSGSSDEPVSVDLASETGYYPDGETFQLATGASYDDELHFSAAGASANCSSSPFMVGAPNCASQYGATQTFSTPPQTTGPNAGSVTSTTATVTSQVASGNDPSTASEFDLEYGAGGYTLSVPMTATTSDGTTTLTANLTGLTPGSTYQERVVAEGVDGGSTTADGVAFTTQGTNPATAVTGTATVNSNSSVTFTGTVTPPSSGSATSWTLEYTDCSQLEFVDPPTVSSCNPVPVGSGTIAAGTTGAQQVSATANSGTAGWGRELAYRLVVTDANQNVSEGTTKTVDVPLAVTDGATVDFANDSAELTGNCYAAASSCFFQLGTGTGYGTKLTAVSTLDASASLYAATATGLAPNTTYHYRVVAVGSSGFTSYGPDETFSTSDTPVAVTPSPGGSTGGEGVDTPTPTPVSTPVSQAPASGQPAGPGLGPLVPWPMITPTTTPYLYTLDGAKSTDQGAKITAWTWRLRSHVIGRQRELAYEFPKTGTYRLRLTVADSAHRSASKTIVAHVKVRTVKKRFTLNASLLFAKNSHKLRPHARAKLAKVRRKLMTKSLVQLTVVGHSADGPANSLRFSGYISKARAETVRHFLLTGHLHLVRHAKITAKGVGHARTLTVAQWRHPSKAERRRQIRQRNIALFARFQTTRVTTASSKHSKTAGGDLS